MSSKDEICNDPKCIFVRDGIKHKVNEHSSLSKIHKNGFQSDKKIKILSKIPLKNAVDFIAFSSENNHAFTSENKGNQISKVDFDSKIITNLANVERPREIIFSPAFNRIYAIFGNMGLSKRNTGKQVCVIDVDTSQIIKIIGNKEGFGGLTRDSKTNRILITQPHKKKVWVLDENSLTIGDKISVKGNYKYIIFNGTTDEIIMAGSFGYIGKHRIAIYENKTKKIRKIFSQIQSQYGEVFKIKYFPKLNKIFAYLATNFDDSGNGNTRIHLIDYSKPDSNPRISTRSHILEDFDVDVSRNLIYYLQIGNSGKSKYGLVARNLVTDLEELFPYELGYSIYPTVFEIHPQTGNLISSGQEENQFYLFEFVPP